MLRGLTPAFMALTQGPMIHSLSRGEHRFDLFRADQITDAAERPRFLWGIYPSRRAAVASAFALNVIDWRPTADCPPVLAR